jgi:hypothetical protein
MQKKPENFYKEQPGRQLFFVLLFCLSFTITHAQPAGEEEVPDEDVPFTNTEEVPKKNFRKNNYTVIYADSLQLRKVPADKLRAMQESDDFWYANYDFSKKKKDSLSKVPRIDTSRLRLRPDSLGSKGQNATDGSKVETRPVQDDYDRDNWLSSLGRQGWFRFLIWTIIIGGFLFALINYLINSDIGLFGKKKKKIELAAEEEKDMPENIFEIPYLSEIDKAAAQGNYRLAIRLMYLELLKNCAERNIIQYKQERTNMDYLMQIASTAWYKDFFRLTRHFEYAWYGKFDISPQAYTIVKNEFTDFNRQLK